MLTDTVHCTCLHKSELSIESLQHVLQPCQEKFGMGYLERARLGQVWQPWYADLMRQGGLSGAPLLDTTHSAACTVLHDANFMCVTCIATWLEACLEVMSCCDLNTQFKGLTPVKFVSHYTL